jgi:hypothetical protein
MGMELIEYTIYFICRTSSIFYLCMHIQKARSSEPEETAVARERLGKHVPAAMDTHAAIEKSLETVFSVRSVPVAMWSAPAMTGHLETVFFGFLLPLSKC